MVITIEPGIYIPLVVIVTKWCGEYSIEDDILITPNGPVNLSAEAPRKWQEIEELMKEKCFTTFSVPNLD
jgi:Xaa-Pro aminopeptidase